jgi:hypothetical protein
VPAELVHEHPSILVSELYEKGAPRAVVMERQLLTPDGPLKVMITPGEDAVTSVAVWPRGQQRPQRVARRAKVEWQPWRFGSRRPWVHCEWCGRRCSRLFLALQVLAGSLLCHKCAGVRYRSQDLSRRERLIQSARNRSSPAPRVCGRPRGRAWRSRAPKGDAPPHLRQASHRAV